MSLATQFFHCVFLSFFFYTFEGVLLEDNENEFNIFFSSGLNNKALLNSSSFLFQERFFFFVCEICVLWKHFFIFDCHTLVPFTNRILSFHTSWIS